MIINLPFVWSCVRLFSDLLDVFDVVVIKVSHTAGAFVWTDLPACVGTTLSIYLLLSVQTWKKKAIKFKTATWKEQNQE